MTYQTDMGIGKEDWKWRSGVSKVISGKILTRQIIQYGKGNNYKTE